MKEVMTRIELDWNYINRLVEEGKRVGKTPWSCCIFHERKVFAELNDGGSVLPPKYPQATYEETKQWCKIKIDD